MKNSKAAFEPSNELLALIEKINNQTAWQEEYEQSEDSGLAEFVLDFGYRDDLQSIHFDRLENKELADQLTTWLKADERSCADFLIEHSSLEFEGSYFYQTSEIYGQNLGECEVDLDEYEDELKALSEEEYSYLQRNTDASISDRRYAYINLEGNRWIRVLNEESALAALPSATKPKKKTAKVKSAPTKPVAKLSLVQCVITDEDKVKYRMNAWTKGAAKLKANFDRNLRHDR